MATGDAAEESMIEREGLGWTLLGMRAMASVWDDPEDAVHDEQHPPGVVVRLSGRRPGLNKVALTELDGGSVMMTLGQFASLEA